MRMAVKVEAAAIPVNFRGNRRGIDTVIVGDSLQSGYPKLTL
jgi:hypothetical protein